MKDYPIAEAKAHFSEIVALVENGESVAVTRGKKRKAVAYLISPKKFETQAMRTFGSLEHWGEITISKDWGISDEELLGL